MVRAANLLIGHAFTQMVWKPDTGSFVSFTSPPFKWILSKQVEIIVEVRW